MNEEIPKAYDPAVIEDQIYARWEQSGFFDPDNLRHEPTNRLRTHEQGSWWQRLRRLLQPKSYNLQPFTIVMPPPNVTGVLHVGHAVMLAIEDIMVRFARMRGRPTLWIPGTDHAAIATQTVVEKKLIKEGIKDPRREMGREKFLVEVEKFARASHDTIVGQVKKMGASCDWSREAYTMDEPRSLAVRTMFKMMHDDGLIYRGDRIVNWCPRCKSTLADDEVLYREEKSPFYYFKYGPVVIGTARPETKFADKTIVVHPEDERYKKIVGTSFEVEWIEGKVQSNVIADPVIDKDFGTGAMTITPAHSFEDFDLAQKYKLPVVKIIDEAGNLTAAAGSFAGRNTREARADIVKKLADKGLVDHIDENYIHNLSVCYRCDTPVEPLPKLQWFIDVKKPVRGKSLKDRMREVVANNEIKIIPERFGKEYFRWIDNLRDWCISRQIWFGHRIPVWYREKREKRKEKRDDTTQFSVLSSQFSEVELYVGTEPPEGEGWIQDEDTLDTWFSSGLWTFSALGWPTNCVGSTPYTLPPTPCRKAGDLAKFHPTSVLETGYDILFFWIARMVMMTTYALGEIPFQTVYLHGLVRDEQGRKMSKSIGNVINPLDTIAKYGADATRLSLVLGTAPGNDVKLSEAKIAGYRNFTNKLWNIARFILSSPSMGEDEGGGGPPSPNPSHQGRGNIVPKTLADRWILQELDRVTIEVTKHLEKYEFSPAGELLRDFTWGSLADWYLEISKHQSQTLNLKPQTSAILQHCLERLLKLWHPFMPFVTETIWKLYATLPNPSHRGRGFSSPSMGEDKGEGDNLLMVAEWPEVSVHKITKSQNQEVKRRFEIIQQIITAIRNIRAENKIEPAKKIDVVVSAGADTTWLREEIEIIKHLGRVEKLEIGESVARPAQSATALVGSIEVSVSLAGLVDPVKEKERLRKLIDETRAYVNGLAEKLVNKELLARAPVNVTDDLRARHAESQAKLAKLEEQLQALLTVR